MKIDQFKTVITEESAPGCYGDSAAETGRLCVLDSKREYDVDLTNFVKPDGFWRHPLVPAEWGPQDFTSDQMLYLLMGAYVRDQSFFNSIIYRSIDKMTKPLSFDVRCMIFEAWNWLALSQVVQMFINTLPFRWTDDQSRSGFWNYWRFTSSEGSTVSYVSVFVAMVFLNRVGVTWPSLFFNREKYLAKVMSYYTAGGRLNTDWFIALYEGAQT